MDLEDLPLKGKQVKFVEAYCGVSKQNASDAARRAGYSKKTAASMGALNLKKPHIKKAIAERTQKALGKFGSDDILKGILEIAQDKKASNKDRLKAYELLGKNKGLWVKRIEHSGEIKGGGLPRPNVAVVDIGDYATQARKFAGSGPKKEKKKAEQ